VKSPTAARRDRPAASLWGGGERTSVYRLLFLTILACCTEDADAQWQREEATGADRRAFADQSIVQHRSMFSRFNDYLIAHHATVASYGADHLDVVYVASRD